MSRRCEPGQKARVLKGMNQGRVVLVVRALHGQEFEGSIWPLPIYPWVVSGVGGPLRTRCISTGLENPPMQNIVACDLELEPIDDHDDSNSESTTRRKRDHQPA